MISDSSGNLQLDRGSKTFNEKLTPEIVEDVFKILLKRQTGNDAYVAQMVSRDITVRQFMKEVCNSSEFFQIAIRETRKLNDGLQHPLARQESYRAPPTFSVTSNHVTRVLAVGSCFLESQINCIRKHRGDVAADIYLLSNALPERPHHEISEYQFQIVQLPLRSALPDYAFARLGQNDLTGHEELFEHAKTQTKRLLEAAMRWNRAYGILTFAMSFPVPQQNLVGRLMPRYDLRNPVYFVEQLNQFFAEQLTSYQHAFLVDINEITSSLGKRFFFEDQIAAFNHGGVISDFDHLHDQQRIEPAERVSNIYQIDTDSVNLAIWHEMIAMFRTVRQIDSVKMLVIDLDDTLWRGIIAEADPDALPTAEGWPIGFREALLLLKRRGVILAIISKNEESRVREVWPKLIGRNGISLEDFAVIRINWRQKSENMAEILKATNLLARNVVYIDDNPAQRDDIQRAYPDIRVLGGTPSVWHHSLLWAAETQMLTITAESSARTAMIQAQVRREEERSTLAGDEFLRSLDVQMIIFPVTDTAHPRFARVIELINKTNQFNTTGKRWTQEECLAAFNGGARFYAFEVSDRFTDYGLVGVLIVDDGRILQFVMSCRIMGLDAELAAVAYVGEQIRALGSERIFASMLPTDRNLPCRDVYARSGFVEVDGEWSCAPTVTLGVPDHITIRSC